MRLETPKRGIELITSDLTEKAISFISQCKTCMKLNNIAPCFIGNMDETAIWYDMPGATTVAVKGTNSVPLLTTGHEKQHITVCLAAMANGCRLKPLIVFKGKRFPNELKGITEAIVKLSSNGWMNEELTLQWMEGVGYNTGAKNSYMGFLLVPYNRPS